MRLGLSYEVPQARVEQSHCVSVYSSPNASTGRGLISVSIHRERGWHAAIGIHRLPTVIVGVPMGIC